MGIPTLVVGTRAFEPIARMGAKAAGAADPRLLLLEHPIAGLSDAKIRERTEHALPQMQALLGHERRNGAVHTPSESETALTVAQDDAPDDLEAFLPYAIEHRLSDGLPVIPPTAERVATMLAAFPGDPKAPLGVMPPRNTVITPEAVAICAVMAGCLPEYLPVIVGTLRAVIEPEFNLKSILTTTHPSQPFALISGPLATRIGMNAGVNALGVGNRANATIGRAVSLCMRIVGGAFPGETNMSTQGSPGQYSYVAAENVTASPWGSLAAARGYAGDADCVTVIAGETPHNVNDHESITGLGVLRMMAAAMRNVGMNNSYYDSDVMVMFCPEHASTVAGDGYSREDIQMYLFKNARIPIGWYSDANVDNRLRTKWPKDFTEFDPNQTVPVVQRPDSFLIAVVGGPGKQSSWVPTFGLTRAVTRQLP